jgi:hypothetical protein
MSQQTGLTALSWRVALAAATGLLTFAYVAATVIGLIPEQQRIDGTSLTLIVIAIICSVFLLRPNIFDYLSVVEIAGFKVQLNRLQRLQEEQEETLTTIKSILPLLLPALEVKHMKNLFYKRTENYIGGYNLQTELRRLRSIQIIKMVNNKYIGELEDGKTYNLADYVELTKLGEKWVGTIQRIEAKSSPSDTQSV